MLVVVIAVYCVPERVEQPEKFRLGSVGADCVGYGVNQPESEAFHEANVARPDVPRATGVREVVVAPASIEHPVLCFSTASVTVELAHLFLHVGR